MSSHAVVGVDLFAGAGGLSAGFGKACESLGHAPGENIRLIAVNHNPTAIETHRTNHPWAEHHDAKIEELYPPDIVKPGTVDVMTAGPKCVHFTKARGGKPVKEQERASAWQVLHWVELLLPTHLLIENVPEFESWGRIEEDGTPTRDGSVFERWVGTLQDFGYTVDTRVLKAADYGDPTTRKRLFVVGSREKQPTYPEPTHSESGEGDLKPWRTASEIINWDDIGTSVWTRSRPLSENTMKRIAVGIRKHCDERLEPYADAIASITPEQVESMQETIVDIDDLEEAVDDFDRPFLVKGPSIEAGVEDDPGSTTMIMGQHSGATARDASESPVPTIATRGAIHCISANPFVLPRNGAYRGLHSNGTYKPGDRPFHTVTAKNHDGHLIRPFLVEYYGNSDVADIDDPLPTVTTKDRHALCVPDLAPWGLDLKYRMLQPPELKQAQGFDEDYHICGDTKKVVTMQIGNAVPVNTAAALCRNILTSVEPSLSTFGAGISADETATTPDYEDVISSLD